MEMKDFKSTQAFPPEWPLQAKQIVIDMQWKIRIKGCRLKCFHNHFWGKKNQLKSPNAEFTIFEYLISLNIKKKKFCVKSLLKLKDKISEAGMTHLLYLQLQWGI